MPNGWGACVTAFCYATVSLVLVLLLRASMTAHVIGDTSELVIAGLEDRRFIHPSSAFRFTIMQSSVAEDYFKQSNKVLLITDTYSLLVTIWRMKLPGR